MCLIWSSRLAAVGALIGFVVLIAYAFGWEHVWRPLAGGPATHPWTATSLVLLGLSVVLARPRRKSNMSALLAAIAGCIALARLVSAASGQLDLFQTWSPFHVILMEEALAGHPIIMSVRTGVMILFLAVSLCLLRVHYAGPSQIFAAVAAFPLLTSMIGYLFGSPHFHGQVALPTLVAGLLCVVGALFRTAHRAPFRSILITRKSSRVARLQIGVLVGLTLLLGTVATRSGFDRNPEVVAVEATILVLIIVLVLSITARLLERLHLSSDDNSTLVRSLAGAWDRGEMFLVYQPQINLVTGEFVGVEALVRWHHSTIGLVSPKDFIPLAESAGLIVPLGAWVLRTACGEAKRWRNSNLDLLTVAVNASAFQLVKPGFLKMVKQTLHETGLPPHRLVLEVTESAMMREADDALRILGDLRALGISIAIDDFGTGYSSLSYLRSLPSDYLKIDQSFVHELPGDAGAATLSRAVIALGHSFGLKVVAEGVETSEQAEFLRENGCHKGQGYLYSKPLPPDDLLEWAEAWSRRGPSKVEPHAVV
jgi:EAL domain-containing protein (putative c-di-GMP-specific phosphodiesterase class I)